MEQTIRNAADSVAADPEITEVIVVARDREGNLHTDIRSADPQEILDEAMEEVART